MRWIAIFLLAAPVAWSDLVTDVRVAAAQGNLPLGDSLINNYRGQRGITPEMLEAMSWMARGAYDHQQLDRADSYAHETEAQVRTELKRRALDSDPHLALALGAAIEVEAQVLSARSDRNGALALLRKDLVTYGRTSIRARIQKNINLLSLEGKPAPPLEEAEFLGGKPVPLSALQGKPVLLFFWAHWCGDCKAEEPLLAQLRREYASRGLTIVAPTQRYGYAAGGEDATPQQELRYIEAVRQHFYVDMLDVPAPVSEQNFKLYGASTTPTIVLIDRHGIVRLYHPGAMRLDELRAAVKSVL